MKKKPRASAKRGTRAKRPAKKKPVSDATRAADDVLREKLRTADLSKFDQVLAKAIRPGKLARLKDRT